MGEIAEMLINGDLDFYTGEYIGRGKGFPRTINGELPWEKDTSWKKVTGWMQNQGIKKHLHPDVVKAYGAPYPRTSGLRKACTFILKDFDKFKEWLTENKAVFIKTT